LISDLTITSQQQFLATLRLLHDPSTTSKIGIPALDKLLANHTTRFDPTNLSAIPAPPIIEITSPGPKSGKTELLYWMIANLVLGSDGRDTTLNDEPHPTESTRDCPEKTPDHARDHITTDSEVRIEGDDTELETNTTHDPFSKPDHQVPPPSTKLKEHHHTAPTTIALLTTSPINISRLSQILLHHLPSSSPHLPLSTAQSLIHSALSHIHIFQPTSLSSLIATASSLPTYFLDPKNGSAERRVGAIIIDSPFDYFWADKVTLQGQQGQQTQGKYPALASTLKRISTTLCSPIIFSTAHLSATSATSATQALRPQLPSPFPTLPSLRLIISRTAIQGFTKETDAETAVKHKESRDKVVVDASFIIRINKWANEAQRDNSGDRDTAGFEVKIDSKGITVL